MILTFNIFQNGDKDVIKYVLNFGSGEEDENNDVNVIPTV